jgi:hypothetical protein
MTDARLEPPFDVRLRVDLYLDAVQKAQQAAGAPADEAAGIRDDLRAQIFDMLAARATGRTPTVEDAEAVLAQLEPPEAYGPAGEACAGVPPRAQSPSPATVSPAAQAAPLPAGSPKPKFSRTALIGLLGFLPVFGFCVLGVPAAFMGHRYHAAVSAVGPQFEQAPMAKMSWVFIFLAIIPLMGMLWTMICGIAAIVQIRRAAGQVTGLWLAVFETVLFPILALVVLVLGALACA